MQRCHSLPLARHPAGHQVPVAVMLFSLGVLLAGVPTEAAHFQCPAADVTCLIAAINQANANGEDNTIVLAAGAYTLTAVDNDTDGANGLPSVTGTLTIRGAGAELTSISRDTTAPPFRLLHVAPAGVLTVQGLTLTNGVASAVRGAGILALGSVTIRDSIVSKNGRPEHPGTGTVTVPSFGGGVAGGAVVITHSTIKENHTHFGGGGIDITAGGSLTVTDSVIANNASDYDGGGVRFVSSGALTITDTLIVDNFAGRFYGGGLMIGGGGNTTTITRSTIAANMAIFGGGIEYYGSDGHLTIVHSAIVGNQAHLGGGGVRFTAGTVTIMESTIANNATGIAGAGGIAGFSPGIGTVTNSTIVGNTAVGRDSLVAGIAGDLRLQNSIVAGNTATDASGGIRSSDCGGSIVSLGNNLFGDPVGCGPLVLGDRTGDPGLGTFVDPGRPGTAHVPLLAVSQAIDAGDNAVCGATDQQGLVRPIDGDGDAVRTCDIGAIEFYPVVNDMIELDSLRSTYVPPSRRDQKNPLTAGGTFEIAAVFANHGAQNICDVAFQVIALHGEAGGSPTVVTRRGALIGGEGVTLAATLADAKEDLRAHRREKYQFTIGLSQEEPITFLVNVLGEATAGRCGP